MTDEIPEVDSPDVVEESVYASTTSDPSYGIEFHGVDVL